MIRILEVSVVALMWLWLPVMVWLAFAFYQAR